MHRPRRVKALGPSEDSSRAKRSNGAEKRALEGEGGLDSMARTSREAAAYVTFHLVLSRCLED